MPFITDPTIRERISRKGLNPDDPAIIEAYVRSGRYMGPQPNEGFSGDVGAFLQGTWRGLSNTVKGVANLPTAVGAFVGLNENPAWWDYTEPTWTEKANPWASGAGNALGFIAPMVATGGVAGAGGVTARGLGALGKVLPAAGKAATALEAMATGGRAARLVPQALEAASFAGLTTPGTIEERAASALQMGVFGAAQGALGAPLHLGRLKTAAWEGAVGALAGGLTGSPIENVPGAWGGGAMGAALGFLTGGKKPTLPNIDAARKAGEDVTSTPFVKPTRKLNPLAPVRQAGPLTARQQYEIEAPQVSGTEARSRLVGMARQEVREVADALSAVDNAPLDPVDQALVKGVSPREISAGVVELPTGARLGPEPIKVGQPAEIRPNIPYDPLATNAATARALGVDPTPPPIRTSEPQTVGGTTPYPGAPMTDLSRPPEVNQELLALLAPRSQVLKQTTPKNTTPVIDGPLPGEQEWQWYERTQKAKGNQTPLWDMSEPTVEMVPVEDLLPLREYNRETSTHKPGNIEALTKDIARRGIQTKLTLIYYQGDRRVKLGEGNHRLVAARQAGLKEVPVRVIRYRGNSDGTAVPVRGIDPDSNGFVPAELTPSSIGLRGRTLTKVEREARAPLEIGDTTLYPNAPFTDLTARPVSTEPISVEAPIPPPSKPTHPALVVQELNVAHALTQGGVKGRMERIKSWAQKNFGRTLTDEQARKYATTTDPTSILDDFPVSGVEALQTEAAQGAKTRGTKLVDPRKRSVAATAERAGKLEQAGKGSDTYFAAEAAANKEGTTYAAIVHARSVFDAQNPRTRSFGTVAEQMRQEGWNVNVARRAAQIVSGEAKATKTYDALTQLPEIVQKFVADPVKKKLAEAKEREVKAQEAAQAKLAKATEQRARSVERQTKVLTGLHGEIDLQNPRFEKIKDRLTRLEERLSSGKPIKEIELQTAQRAVSGAKKSLAAEAQAEANRVAAAAKKAQAKLAETHLPKIREAQVAAAGLLKRLPFALKRLEEAQAKWAEVQPTGDYRKMESAGKRLAEAAQEVKGIQEKLGGHQRDLADRQANAAAENVLLNERLRDAQIDLDGQMADALYKLDNLDLQTASMEGARTIVGKMADDLGQREIPGGMADSVLTEDGLFAHMVGYLGNKTNTYIAKAQAGLKWFTERKVVKENKEAWPASHAVAAEDRSSQTPHTLREWLEANDPNVISRIEDNSVITLEFKDTGQSYFFDNPQQAALFYDREMQRRIVEPEMGPEGVTTTLPPDATPRPPKIDPENPEAESGGNLPPKPDGGEGPGDPPDIGTPREEEARKAVAGVDKDISRFSRLMLSSEPIFRKVDKMWLEATGKPLGLTKLITDLHTGYAGYIRESTQRIDELSAGLQKFGFVKNGRLGRADEVAFDAALHGIDAEVFDKVTKANGDIEAVRAELPEIMARHVARQFRGEARARALQFVQYYDGVIKAVADDAGVPLEDRQLFYYRRSMENSPALTVRTEGERLETSDWIPGFQQERVKTDPEALVDETLMQERAKLGIDPDARPFTSMVSGYVRGVYRHKNMNLAVGGLQRVVGQLSPNLNGNLREWVMQEIRRARGMQLEAEAAGSRRRATRALKMAQALKRAHDWLGEQTEGPLSTGLTPKVMNRLKETYESLGITATEGHLRSWMDSWVQLHRSSIFGLSVMRPVRDLVTTDLFLLAPRFDARTLVHVFKTINPLNPDFKGHIQRYIDAGVLQPETIMSDSPLAAPRMGRTFWNWTDKLQAGYTSLDQKMRAQSAAAAEYLVDRGMQKYSKTGKFGDFIEATSLDSFGNVADAPTMAELEARIKRGDREGAWRMLAKIYQDGINFNYSLVNKPGYLDRSVGRFLGQYGTWPISAINSMWWMARGPWELAKQGVYTPQQARKRTLLLGTKYALAAEGVYAMGAAFGVDTGDWIPFVHSVYYTGGPGLSMGAEALDIARGEPQIMARFKKEPWMTTANYARRFIPIPASEAFRRSMSQTESIGDYPTLQRVLGLPQFQREWNEQMAVRMGFFPWERPLKKTVSQNLATMGVGAVMAPIQDALSEAVPILPPGSRNLRSQWRFGE